jgi:hypothetical protein
VKAQDADRWRARLEAVKLCRGDLGRRADREGWLCALIDFAQERGRLPSEREVDGCKAEARKSQDGLDALRGGPYFRSFSELRENMLARARKDVFGGPAQLQAAE